MKLLLFSLITFVSIIMLADEDESLDIKSCLDKANELADEQFKLLKVGDNITFISNIGRKYSGKYIGTTSNNAVLIGDSKISWIDIPDGKKYMFSEELCSKVKKKFIDEYITSGKGKLKKDTSGKSNIEDAENRPVLTFKTIDGCTYENVTIQKITPSGLEIMYRRGVAFIDFSILPDDVQKKYNYDPMASRKYKLDENKYKEEFNTKKYNQWLKTLAKYADENFTEEGMFIESKAHYENVRTNCISCRGTGASTTASVSTNDSGRRISGTVLGGSTINGSKMEVGTNADKRTCWACNGTGLKTEEKFIPFKTVNPKEDSNLANAYWNLAIKITNGEEEGTQESAEKYAKISSALCPKMAYKHNYMQLKGDADQMRRDAEQAKVDAEKAKRDAERGNKVAQCKLGMCYLNGIGVGRDEEKALDWLTKSAEQGSAEAQSRLGSYYSNNTSVIKDYIEAYKWFLIAGANGYDVQKEISFLAEVMSKEKIAESQKKANEFLGRNLLESKTKP